MILACLGGGLGCAAAALLLTPAVRRCDVPGFAHVVLAAILGAGAAAIGVSWLHTLALCAAAVGCSLLVAVDLRTHRLPRAILLPTYAVVVPLLVAAAALGGSWDPLGRAGLAALALGAFYFLLGAISPSGIGFGDVTFAPLLGLVLGWFGWPEVLVGTLAAFVLGAFGALILMALRRADPKTRIAFGPWMVLGAVIALALL